MFEVLKKKLSLNIKFKVIFKKIFKFFKYIISIILFTLIIFIIFKIKNEYSVQQNLEENLETNIIKQDENTISIQDTLDDFKENIEFKEELLKNKIESLENIVKVLEEKINSLQNNILDFENNSPTNNEKNLQIIILLYKIQDIVYKGGDFSKYFEYLVNISKNRELIFENVLKIEKYRNQKIQKDLKNTFFNEYLNLLSLKNNKNKIKTFLDSNVKIRKISNFDENVDKISIDISNIEKNIETFNYKDAISIIVDNNYSQYFKDTLEILSEKNEVILIINKIFDFIYGI